jgi:VWFA-related protein
VTTAFCSVALVAALLAGEEGGVPHAPPVFGVSVDAVKLDVTVKRAGRAVMGLTAADFEVRDDGVVQEVELVAAEDRTLHAVLVLDTSSSVAGARLASLQAAASAFVAGLAPQDAASVIVFSHRIYALPQDPYDHEGLRDTIMDLRSSGSTALNDAIFAGLMRGDTGRGRPVVVVFSDGANILSWLEPQQVLEAAKGLEAVVYGVLTSPPIWDEESYSVSFFRKRAGPKPRPGILQDLAALTGGAVFEAVGGRIEEAFRRILDTVQSRYVLSYVPRGVKEVGWHSLQVRLERADGTVGVRKGYRRLGH